MINGRSEFDIELLETHWLPNLAEEEDRCLHGTVFVRIGEETLSNESSGEWTVSATALYLMRSLSRDYEIDSFGSQLLPCCGHFLIGEDNDSVTIIGCSHGIDWTIKHKGNTVIHTSKSGNSAEISLGDYSKLVLNFADTVENMFVKSKPKKLPEDEFDRKGYEKFWIEWHVLRKQFSIE